MGDDGDESAEEEEDEDNGRIADESDDDGNSQDLLEDEDLVDPDMNLDSTAEVLRMQRLAYPSPEKPLFWRARFGFSFNDLDHPFGLPQALEASGELCYLKSCRNRLQRTSSGEVTVILHNYKTCKSKSLNKRANLTNTWNGHICFSVVGKFVRKTCSVCRAAHDWFGWGIGFHNFYNKVILSFAFLLECEAAFIVSQSLFVFWRKY
jgi:hypothetical protein